MGGGRLPTTHVRGGRTDDISGKDVPGEDVAGEDAVRTDARRSTGLDADPQVIATPVAQRRANAKADTADGHWRGRYQAAAVTVDLIAAVVAVLGAFVIRFGSSYDDVHSAHLITLVALPLAWLAGLGLNRAYEVRFLGAGAIEYERLGKAFLEITALTTFTAYATHADLSRGFILLALPATLVFSVAGRYGLRKVVHRARRNGRAHASVLAVGGPAEVIAFTDNLVRNEHAGLHVTAACLASKQDATDDEVALLAHRGVALVGDLDSIREAAVETGASTVAVIANHISGEQLRWISWQLEGTDTDLVLLPALTEVAGRRLSITQVGGLPLLHMGEPEFKGVRRAVKGGFDRIAALLGLIVLLPTFLFVAAAIRLTSRGPAFFTQIRVGKDGKAFRMVKFRSMVVGAEAHLEQLGHLNEVSGGNLFKIREDPRVTSVGRFIRRFSIDELPQLLNVLTGSMSLVGPRPPLPVEVAKYGGEVRRRLLVKPGMTGLWQISGRSDLTWEESVRIDLRYVENWSLALDAFVLAKTVRAVLKADGAY